jgi:hypothetical protein
MWLPRQLAIFGSTLLGRWKWQQQRRKASSTGCIVLKLYIGELSPSISGSHFNNVRLSLSLFFSPLTFSPGSQALYDNYV